MPNGERRLAAIMFTDIVGYTSLTQRGEADVWMMGLGTEKESIRETRNSRQVDAVAVGRRHRPGRARNQGRKEVRLL